MTGPTLPKRIMGSSMVSFEGEVILIGGFETPNLYRLSSPNGTWLEMEQTLTTEKIEFVSFLVPDELVNCH